MRIRWSGQAVVHPLALAPGSDDACLPQISEMPGDLRLGRADDFREIADADFLIGHQIEEAQAGGITQGAEEPIQRRLWFHG